MPTSDYSKTVNCSISKKEKEKRNFNYTITADTNEEEIKLGRKKRKPTHQPFESKTEHGQFVKIALDMMHSNAWRNLTLRQQGLYLIMKSKYRPFNQITGVLATKNERNFVFTHVDWNPYYNNNWRAWKTDLDALKKNGFIEIIEHGKSTRTANIYSFSSKWKEIK